MAFDRLDKKNKPPAWRQFGGILAIMLFLLLLFGLAAGVTAQTDDLIVTITEIDSQAFPQVVVSVAVSDENGPVEDLTGANFQIVADEVEVSPASYTVEPDVSQDVRLVLALDVSISGNDPAEIKSAATALLDSLGLGDRVAVMTFGDEVELVHDFTNNHEELKTVIAGLNVGGSLTALHDVIIEALALADQAPGGRRAVVVITDSRDNVGGLSATETVAKIRETQIPLSIIGFGNKVRADQLRAELRPSGGQYVVLANSGQVQESLLQIVEQLRRGYQITFQSDSQADETEHGLSIAVSDQNGEAQADGRFVATRNPIVVNLTNLRDEQTVGGRIDLTPEITAAAAPTSVEYRLDGRTLRTVDAAPFGYSWDSTAVESGPHTLTVRAVDRAGNSGQTELNLNVVMPVEVAVSTAQTRVELGSEIDIQVEIETIEELAMVELLLDDRILASHTAPPFGFSLDSSQYPQGVHRITVRAEDRLGRQAQDELTMQFLAPPPPEPPFWRRWLTAFRQSRWSQYLLAALRWGLAALIILGLAIFGLILVARSQKRVLQKIYPVAIANLGNARSRYQLRVDEPSGALSFQFILDGVSLSRPAAPPGMVGPVPPRGAQVTPAPSPPPAAPGGAPATHSEGYGGARQTIDKARSAGQEAQGCAYAIAGIFSTLSYLLPGSAGRSVARLGQTISAGQGRVRQATNVPVRLARTAGQLQSQVGQLAPSGPQTRSPAGTTEIGPGTGEPMDSGSEAVPVRAAHQAPANGRQLRANGWAQTPFVDPDEQLAVDLLISPIAKPYRTQTYTFTVLSKTSEQENASLITEEASIEMPGVSRLRRLIPYLIYIIMMMIVTVVVIFLVMNLEYMGQYWQDFYRTWLSRGISLETVSFRENLRLFK